MGLMPRRINGMLKRELAAAGIKYERTQDWYSPSSMREYRKAPAQKVANRAGVHKYYDYEIKDLVTGDVDRVDIPLNMHIGAPAEAVVKTGDRVNVGDLIAASRQGKLGAKIHESISGRVSAVGDRITIIKE